MLSFCVIHQHLHVDKIHKNIICFLQFQLDHINIENVG